MDPLTTLIFVLGGALLLDAGTKPRKREGPPPISEEVEIEGQRYVVPTYPETRLTTRSDLGIEPYVYEGDLFVQQRVAIVLSWSVGARVLIGRVVSIEPESKLPDAPAQRLRVQLVSEFKDEEIDPVKEVDIGDQIEISRRNIIVAYPQGVT